MDDIVKILHSGVASSPRIYESKGATFLFNVRMLIAEFQNLINSKTEGSSNSIGSSKTMLPFENTSGCYEVAGKYQDKVKIGTQNLPDPPDQLDPSDPQHSQHRQHRQHSPDPKTPQNHQTQQSRQTYKSVYKIW